jgi:hypothetical protein
MRQPGHVPRGGRGLGRALTSARRVGRVAAKLGGTLPFEGLRVGHGVEAVNEQITLGAGTWELALTGGAAPVEVRWPC